MRRNNTIQYGDYGILGCDTMIYLLLGTQRFDRSSYLLQLERKTLLPPWQWGVADSFRMLVFTYKTIHHHLDIHHSENTESEDDIKCRSDALLW